MGRYVPEQFVRPFLAGPIAPKPKTHIPLPVSTEESGSGFAVITGAGQMIALSHSFNSSFSRSIEKESERTFDTMRVKNPDDPEQHVDVEAVVRMAMQLANGLTAKRTYAKPKENDDVEIIDEGRKRANPDVYGKAITP